MKTRNLAWVIALILGLGLALSGIRSVAASPSADPLPPMKNPASAQFDMTGEVSLLAGATGAGFTVPFNGTGAVSGSDFQLDLTASLPDIISDEATSSTANERLVGDKFYSRTYTSPGPEGQWYVSDGSAFANNPLGGVGSVLGINPNLSEFYTVTQLDKGEVAGVATTGYNIEIDLIGLVRSTGLDSGDSVASSEYTIAAWLGDKDQYVHKADYSLSVSTGSGDSAATIGVRYEMTFHDFDVPVTITAPEGAIEQSSDNVVAVLGVAPGSLAVSTTGSSGMPDVMPVVEDSGMVSAGMPRTGGSTGDGSLPLFLLALGAGMVLSGVGARRIARGMRRG